MKKPKYLLVSCKDSHTDTPMEPPSPPPPAAAAAEEELIPSLPNDVAVNILARVPRSDHPTLSLVSKPIKSLISSPLFFTTRSLVSSNQHHIYLSLSTSRTPFSLFFFSLNDHNLIHRVPPFPSTERIHTYVSLGPTIFVLGGSTLRGPILHVPIPQVWTLDCRFNKWQPAPPMLVARDSPAAGVIDNKIYVVGGCNSDTWAEVFDPFIGKWEAVPSPTYNDAKQMYASRGFDYKIYASAVVDDKLYAMGIRGGIVYDAKNKVWESMGEQRKTCSGNPCVVDGIIYWFDSEGIIRGFDVKEKVWKEVKGLDTGLPRLFPRFTGGATMANVGEKVMVVWEEDRRNRPVILCSEIGVEKKDNGELWGKIRWVDKVWTPTSRSSYLLRGFGLVL